MDAVCSFLDFKIMRQTIHCYIYFDPTKSFLNNHANKTFLYTVPVKYSLLGWTILTSRTCTQGFKQLHIFFSCTFFSLAPTQTISHIYKYTVNIFLKTGTLDEAIFLFQSEPSLNWFCLQLCFLFWHKWDHCWGWSGSSQRPPELM